jgi:hypothetical protein
LAIAAGSSGNLTFPHTPAALQKRVSSALEQQLDGYRESASRMQTLQDHQPQNDLGAKYAAPDFQFGLLLKVFQSANGKRLLVENQEI